MFGGRGGGGAGRGGAFGGGGGGGRGGGGAGGGRGAFHGKKHVRHGGGGGGGGGAGGGGGGAGGGGAGGGGGFAAQKKKRGGGGGPGGGGGGGGGGLGGPGSSHSMCNNLLAGRCDHGDRCRFRHDFGPLAAIPDAPGHVAAAISAMTVMAYDGKNYLVRSEGNNVLFRVYGDDWSEFSMAMPGPITALAASGRWLFVAYFAVVPGRTAAEVGCVKAILAGAGGVTVDIKAPGQDYAHIHMINAMETTVVGEQPCLFTAGGDGLIKMWSPDAAAGTYTQLGSALEGHIRGVRSLFFDDSTGYLYSGCDDGSIKVWRLRDASPVCAHTIIPPPRADAAPAVPGGGFAAAIAAAGGAGAVAAAVPGAPAAGSRLTTTSHTTAIIGLTQLDLPHASGTFQILVSAAADGSVKLWNVANPEEPRLLPGELAPTVHSAPHGAAAHGAHHRQRTATAMTVQQTEVAPGSPTVIVGFSDGSILGYDIGEGSPVHDWTMANLSNGHRAAVRELWCLDTSMNELISVGDDGKLLVYKGNVEADGLGAGAAPAYGAAPAFGAAPAAAPGYGAYGAPAPAAYGTGIAPAGDFGSGTGPGGW